MKRIIILLGILSVFWVSCEVHPYADFIVDRRYVQPYEMISFTNLSERASSFQWDFGDGTITNIPNPTHVYTFEGIFEVTLTANSSDGHRDMATMTIEVFYSGADFIVDKKFVQPNEQVTFTNLSTGAVSYHWNFGDGTSSNIYSPTHVYVSEGYYTVTLTATYSDGSYSTATQTIEVFYTVLEITVAEWNEQEIIVYIVPDARVRLYPSLNDWDYETNLVAEGYTDNDGVITFLGLQPQRYYVDVYNELYDNYAIRDWDPSYITTQQLVPFQFNSFLAWADYYPPEAHKLGRKNKDEFNKINSKRRSLLISDVSK
jgi:PKD repeat protein